MAERERQEGLRRKRAYMREYRQELKARIEAGDQDAIDFHEHTVRTNREGMRRRRAMQQRDAKGTGRSNVNEDERKTARRRIIRSRFVGHREANHNGSVIQVVEHGDDCEYDEDDIEDLHAMSLKRRKLMRGLRPEQSPESALAGHEADIRQEMLSGSDADLHRHSLSQSSTVNSAPLSSNNIHDTTALTKMTRSPSQQGPTRPVKAQGQYDSEALRIIADHPEPRVSDAESEDVKPARPDSNSLDASGPDDCIIVKAPAKPARTSRNMKLQRSKQAEEDESEIQLQLKHAAIEKREVELQLRLLRLRKSNS